MNQKKNNKYNKKFEKYLNEEFRPAQHFAASDEGRAYIADKIPSLEALRDREDSVLAAVYEIFINRKPVYIGQSLRTVRRLYTHAYHMFTDPETFFGLKQEEIKEVSVVISTPPIFNETLRLAAEEALVRSQKPALQPYANVPGMRVRADACLPRGQARRDAMIKAGVIQQLYPIE